MMLYILIGGSVFVIFYLILSAFSDSPSGSLQKRIMRVGPGGNIRKIVSSDARPTTVRHAGDTGIPLLQQIIRLMPNPDKLRARLARTGKKISLGEYVLINALTFLIVFFFTHLIGWATLLGIFFSYIISVGLPHFVVGFIGNRRIKKFIAAFPEAIDTMCRGLRSGLPVTESIAAVGREMPDPVGTEFHRIADGVRMGKSVESSMWEVAKRVDTPEYRFLIIAMAIQKETGGNLAETLGNLSDLIRRRRQLRMKVKAMSSEAKASAMIIGSLPFIMLCLLGVVNPDYVGVLFHSLKGKIMLAIGGGWMAIGWGVMTKMINFEL